MHTVQELNGTREILKLSILLAPEKQNVDWKTIYSTHSYRIYIRLLCVHGGGRISVTQGRDKDSPTMTSKKQQPSYSHWSL